MTSLPSSLWPMPTIILAAYLLGSLSPGWWLVRQKTGTDLRTCGSGVTGATNAGRVLGTGGFVLVLALDVTKGAAAVLIARWGAPETAWAILALPAAVAGHIWPPWLGFRGGRGVGTLLGGVLAICWPAGLVAVSLGLLAGGVARKKAVAGAVACLIAGPLVWWWVPGLPGRTAFTLAWLLVCLAHRHLLGPAKRAANAPP